MGGLCRTKKKQAAETACQKGMIVGLDVGLRLTETLHAIARLPLIALPEQINALKAFQDVAFDDETGGALEAFVL
jgi:hypothetical protein